MEGGTAGREVHVARAAVTARAQRFSLLRPAPIERLFRILHLEAPPGRRTARRAFALAVLTWLPLLLLVAGQSLLRNAGLYRSFFADLPTHARCLVAIPVLVAAEPLIDGHFNGVARTLLDADLVRHEEYTAYDRALAQAERWRDARWVQWVLVVLAYVGSVVAVFSHMTDPSAPWFVPVVPHAGYSVAGWWQLLVSVPVFELLVLQWLWRWLIWTVLLWRISRLRLQAIATHPDHGAGLRFLSRPAADFGLVAFALGAVLSAAWMRDVLFRGARLATYQPSILAFVVLVLLVTLGPLLVFSPQIYREQQRDQNRYGMLAHEYMQYFDRHWVGAQPSHSEEVLEKLPAETMANVISSHESLNQTRILAFGKMVVIRLVVASLLPMVPLVLTAVPLADIGQKLLRALL